MTDLSNLPAGAKVIRVEQDGGLNKYQTVYQVANGVAASSSSSTPPQTVRLVQQVPARQIVLPQRPAQPRHVIVQQQQSGARQLIIRQPGTQRILVGQTQGSQPGQIIVSQQQVSQPGQGQVRIVKKGQPGQVVYQLAGQGAHSPGQPILIRQPNGQTVRAFRAVNPASSQSVVVQQGGAYIVQSSIAPAHTTVQQQQQQPAVTSVPQQPSQVTSQAAPAAEDSAAEHEHDKEIENNTESPPLTSETEEAAEDAAEPQVDIDINNVVCCFNTRCHLNLKKIATEGANVIYKRSKGMVNMKLRQPRITANIWSSGKITCTGATSETSSKVAARRVTRILQKLGFRVRFSNFRVVNVLGTCAMPWGIRITHFSQEHRENASYEPELHPGVTYRIKDPKATLKVFSTGSITVTAPCVQNVGSAVEHIYPLVFPYRMERPEKESAKAYQYKAPGKIPRSAPCRPTYVRARLDVSSDEDEMDDYEDEEEEELDSDEDEEDDF